MPRPCPSESPPLSEPPPANGLRPRTRHHGSTRRTWPSGSRYREDNRFKMQGVAMGNRGVDLGWDEDVVVASVCPRCRACYCCCLAGRGRYTTAVLVTGAGSCLHRLRSVVESLGRQGYGAYKAQGQRKRTPCSCAGCPDAFVDGEGAVRVVGACDVLQTREGRMGQGCGCIGTTRRPVVVSRTAHRHPIHIRRVQSFGRSSPSGRRPR